jgi:hypothetical protein
MDTKTDQPQMDQLPGAALGIGFKKTPGLLLPPITFHPTSLLCFLRLFAAIPGSLPITNHPFDALSACSGQASHLSPITNH